MTDKVKSGRVDKTAPRKRTPEQEAKKTTIQQPKNDAHKAILLRGLVEGDRETKLDTSGSSIESICGTDGSVDDDRRLSEATDDLQLSLCSILLHDDRASHAAGCDDNQGSWAESTGGARETGPK